MMKKEHFLPGQENDILLDSREAGTL